ncbi:hypothetical protein ACWE42_18720 [Sutcliffiella cohnii]
MKKLAVLLITILIVLVGCSNNNEETSSVIENGQVTLKKMENTNIEFLQFSGNIKITELDTDQPFSVRFLVKDDEVENIIKSTEIVLPDQYFRGNGEIVPVGEMRMVTGEYSVKELEKKIEKENAVYIELFNDDEILLSEPIKTFVQNNG